MQRSELPENGSEIRLLLCLLLKAAYAHLLVSCSSTSAVVGSGVQHPLVKEKSELDRIECLRFLSGKQVQRIRAGGHVLLEPHPVIVEPVADAPRLQVQLLTQEVHGCGAWVRLQCEGDVQRFLLLVTKEDALLFGGSGAVDRVGVHVRGVGR